MRSALFSLLFILSVPAFAEIYKYTDAQGNTVFTNQPPEEGKLIPQVCGSLKEALEELDKGRAFLTKGGVFSDEFIDAYIELKSEEEIKVRTFVHPLEYDLYYSV